MTMKIGRSGECSEYGGSEYVVVFGDCHVDERLQVLEVQVQNKLCLKLLFLQLFAFTFYYISLTNFYYV